MSPIGSNNNHAKRAEAERPNGGFTLIELILVMALLLIVLAIAAPSLSRFASARDLEAEADRLVAVLQFTQNQAVSTGIPMRVILDPDAGQYWIEPHTGFETAEDRFFFYELQNGVRFVLNQRNRSGTDWTIEFYPDGTPAEESLTDIGLEDRRGRRIYVVYSLSSMAYEPVKEEDYDAFRAVGAAQSLRP